MCVLYFYYIFFFIEPLKIHPNPALPLCPFLGFRMFFFIFHCTIPIPLFYHPNSILDQTHHVNLATQFN